METTTKGFHEELMSTYTVAIGSSSFTVTIDPDGSTTVNGVPTSLTMQNIDQTTFVLSKEDATTRIVCQRKGGEFAILLSGEEHIVSVTTERDQLIRKYGRKSEAHQVRSEIHAPMPALVVKVEVREGDEVETGQGLCILEAMKMENELKAHRAGRVRQVLVKEGKTVEKNELLLVLE
jgi:biotin carboxyl carrier protein